MTRLSNQNKMKFEWDEQKRLINLQRHGIDFVDARQVFESDIYTFIDDRFDYGEIRFVSFGLLDGEIVAIVYTEHEEIIRVISIRKTTKNEQQIYFEKFRNQF